MLNSVSSSPQCIGYLSGHKGSITGLATYSAAPSSSGLVSTSEDASIKVWDIESLNSTYAYSLPTKSEIIGVVFDTKNPYVFYFCSENHIYSIDTRISYHLATEIFETNDDINAIDIHPNGSFLASADDSGQIHVIDIRARQTYKTFRSSHDNIATSVQFRPRKPWELWSGSMDQTVCQWDFSKGACANQFPTTDPPSIGGVTSLSVEQSSSSQSVNPPYVHSLSFTPSGEGCLVGLGNGSLRTISSIPKSLMTSGPSFVKKKQTKLRQFMPSVPWAVTDSFDIHRWCISALSCPYEDVVVTGGIDKQIVLSTKESISKTKLKPGDYAVSWDVNQSYLSTFKVNTVACIPRSKSSDPEWKGLDKNVPPMIVAAGGTCRLSDSDYAIELISF